MKMLRLLFALSAVAVLISSPALAGSSPPNAPSNLVASGAFVTPGLGNSLNLTWDDNSNNDAGFMVQASTDGGQTWTSIAYTPNDYIQLHSNNAVPALGLWNGLVAGATLRFRVAATHPTLGTSAYSNEDKITMPLTPNCASPWEMTPFPTLTAHVGFPVDLRVGVNHASNCHAGWYFCKIDTPHELIVDFSGGLITWTPTQSGTYSVTLGYGDDDIYNVCTNIGAKTTLTINVDDYSMLQPLFRDYRSEATEIPLIGGFPSEFSFYAFYSSDLCSTYNGVGCPLSVVSTPNSGPFFPPALLADWDIASIGDGARKLLMMITNSPSGRNSALYDPVIIDRSSFNASWPKRLPNANPRGGVAVDVDGNGSNAEIVGYTRDGASGGPYVWNLDGSLRWQAPSTSSLTTSEVAVGDVNGNGTNEVVTVSQRTVRVFNGPNGALVATATVSSPYTYVSGASLADLNNDGKLEVLVNVAAGTHAWTHVYTYNGTTTLANYSGWPQPSTGPGMDTGYASAAPATADLNSDGVLEVIVDNRTSVYAWSANGTPYFHTAPIPNGLYPDASEVNGGANGFAFAQPSIGDIDPNFSGPEIVVGRNIFRNNGVSIGTITATGDSSGMSAAIGEFDTSASGPEVILGAYVSNGATRALLRTLGTGIGRGPATIVDGGLDAQGLPQTYALMGTMGAMSTEFTANLSAFHSDGSVDEDYPKSLYGSTGPGSAAQAGDFDNDGNEDVLVEVTDSSYGTVVALYKSPGDHPFDPNNNPWPMAGHDPQRTGRNTCKQQRASCTSSPQCCSAKCVASTCR